jgi:hypothetical protein
MKTVTVVALLIWSQFWSPNGPVYDPQNPPAKSVTTQLPPNTVDCDPQMVNGKEVQHCAVEDDAQLSTGKLDVKNAVYFTEEGSPYQCGPMSYYGAYCWKPEGVPNLPKPPKGYLWVLSLSPAKEAKK